MYERIREDGAAWSRALLVALGMNEEGRRSVLGVGLVHPESGSSWRAFLVGLQERGLRCVKFVVREDHQGLAQAIRGGCSAATWQGGYVHVLRNALDHLPQKADKDCLMALRWNYDLRDVGEARRDLAAWPAKWPVPEAVPLDGGPRRGRGATSG